MDLILALIEKYMSCPEPIKLDLQHYHENTKKQDKLARRMLKSVSADVDCKLCGYITSNYVKNELQVEKNTFLKFQKIIGENDLANIFSQAIKAVRVYALYYEFEDKDISEEGISVREKEFICKRLRELEQVIVHSILRHFAKNNLLVKWENSMFSYDETLIGSDLETINFACQIMQFCKMLLENIEQNNYCDALMVCGNLDFEHIYNNKSSHLFYYGM